jgi:hypothetical protein
MQYINNGDSASSIRTKLNLLIDFYNSNSVAEPGPTTPGTSGTSGVGTEGTSGGYTPPPPPPPPPTGTEGTSGTQATGGGNATPITLWGSMMASLMGEDTIQAACDATNTGFSHTAYLVKAPGNISYLPQTGDSIYTGPSLTQTIPSMKYYGYKDGPMMSYNIYMGPGGVSSVNQCV